MTVLDLIERLQRFNPEDTVLVARVVQKPKQIPARTCRGIQSVIAVTVGDTRHVAIYADRVFDRRLL